MIGRTDAPHKALVAALALALLVPTLATADWLVTEDGARVETEGPWRVEGRRVIFELPNGTLSALRLDEVDLDASAEATARAKAPPPTPADVAASRPLPEPVLVLTDKDIPKPPTKSGDATIKTSFVWRKTNCAITRRP